MKYDSHCIECGKPCMAPRGNLNANRVSLCKSKKCRRIRKTILQRERRRQKELFAEVSKPSRPQNRKRKVMTVAGKVG